ncbi:hydroxymethylglutaryl-CoA reductase, partial [Pseudomonas monteilii]|nr:hydroxymethylglutaryl-CoA reductase [Pseudomonas monteilii]
AFAASSIVVERELGLDPKKVNRYGGGISLGHAIGATGARIATTVAYQLKDTQERYGIASLCVGGGLGLAMLLENPSATASQTNFDEESASEKTEKKKFYALAPNERLAFLEAQGAITAAESLIFQEMTLNKETANHMIENQISEVEIPLGVGLNLQVNGKAYNVPLATEEPSV